MTWTNGEDERGQSRGCPPIFQPDADTPGSGRWTTPGGRLISLSHYNGPSFTLDTLWAFTHNPAGQIASQSGLNDAYAWTGHGDSHVTVPVIHSKERATGE